MSCYARQMARRTVSLSVDSGHRSNAHSAVEPHYRQISLPLTTSVSQTALSSYPTDRRDARCARDDFLVDSATGAGRRARPSSIPRLLNRRSGFRGLADGHQMPSVFTVSLTGEAPETYPGVESRASGLLRHCRDETIAGNMHPTESPA
jgi:hypothetical protein